MAYLRVPEVMQYAREAGIPPTPEALAFAAHLSIRTMRRALNGEEISNRTWRCLQRVFDSRDIVTDQRPHPSTCLNPVEAWEAAMEQFQAELDAIPRSSARVQQWAEWFAEDAMERARLATTLGTGE